MQNMDRAPWILAGVLATLTLSAAAHAGPGTNGARVLGYEDPQTGRFHPLPTAVAEATTTPTTGTVEVTFNIKLVTAFAKGTTINCSIDLSGLVENTTTFTATTYEETAGSPATISGSTATCAATIPYSWLVPAASSTTSESFSGSYTVSAYPATTSTTTLLTSAYRSSSSSFVAATAIPASGTVSKYTVNVTL
jgi:hypothetical protein